MLYYYSIAQATKEKINNEIKILKKEIELIRSAVISVLGRDKEGAYNPKFIKEILVAAKENPSHVFTNAKSFLTKLGK